MRKLADAALLAAAAGILALIILRSVDGPTWIATLVGGTVAGACAPWVVRDRQR